MTTNHTTRTALRANALTVVLAGLLLGAPATAFADPSTTPTPPPPRPGLCLSCSVNTPTPQTPVRDNTTLADHLTGSNSGAEPIENPVPNFGGLDPGPSPFSDTYGDRYLSISGDWYVGEPLEVDVYGANGALLWSGPAAATGTPQEFAHFDVTTGCKTRPMLDGLHQFAVARSKASGYVSNKLPVTVATDSNGRAECG
jgi:hypothetical protein